MVSSQCAISVLICSLDSRKDKCEELVRYLEAQRTVTGEDQSEILVECDAGELSVGAKRNLLLDRARGEYVAFVDDDDAVSQNYLASILSAIQDKPDCVGIYGIFSSSAVKQPFCHSIDCAGWYTGSDGTFYRTPNHLNPVRREIALKHRFPLKNFGEDQAYSKAILPYLKSEILIEEPIYLYQYDENKPPLHMKDRTQ